jgi:hypothetical protein
VSAARDFWLASGHHLLDRDAAGNLPVSDQFLKAYLARPEIMPPPEACPAERQLHDALLKDPRRPVEASRVAAIADADARENWQVMIDWRDHLVTHRTLESAYLAAIRRSVRFPNAFIGHLTQAILRNALDGCEDAFTLRAAEMFFRPQKLAMEEDSIIVIDEETASLLGRPVRSPLTALLGLPSTTDIDMLSDLTAPSYWERSDRFDMALDMAAGRRGLAALGDVVVHWISHLLAIDVVVEPLAELNNEPWSWYVGLDSEATRIGDSIWNGNDLDDATRAKLVGLFRLTFLDPANMIEKVRGEPIYLLAAATADDILRLKPQNLLTGLPIRRAEAVN